MNTKILMTSTSLVLGLAGLFTLFTPDLVLATVGAQPTETSSVLIQLMGALYFSFALMNWTAKDSIIGGIYARPISLGNFSHFFSGALLLAKYHVSHELNIFILVVLVVYTIFAIIFYWLVFRSTGIKVGVS